MRRYATKVCLALAMLLIISTTPPVGFGFAQEQSRTFPETGKTVRGVFLEYWDAHGGLPQQGYPISDEMQEQSDIDGKVYTVQYFERAVFELHTENQPPYKVLLSLLGVSALKAKYPAGKASGVVPPGPGTVKRAQCAPTHDDSDTDTGVGFMPEAPVRQIIGKGHVLTGLVLSTADCSPIAGAKLEMRPQIGRAHPDDQRATIYADAEGRYRFESRFPEHIHIRVSAHGFTRIITNSYHTSVGQAEGNFDVSLVPDPQCRLFSTTGQAICGAFMQYWQENGDLAQQGYPISDEFTEVSGLDGKEYRVQYFERAVFEHHPENKAPYDVLLSQLGTLRYKERAK